MAKPKNIPGAPRAPRKINAKPAGPTDPQVTIEVKNDELEETIKSYTAEKTTETLNALVNQMAASRILVPANLNEKKQPMPMIIKNGQGQTFLPIYTSKSQFNPDVKSPAVLNMPYLAINAMALKIQPQLDGIVINPYTSNLIFKYPLLQKVDEVEKKKAEMKKELEASGSKDGLPFDEKKVVKQVKLTGEQYIQFERNRYEFGMLPTKLFSDPEEFMNTLLEKKEEYLDSLYEETYQEKRMYPFLPEDMPMMAMEVSETYTAVSVDMPSRSMGTPSCYRVYFIYNKENKTARYFTIEKTKDGNRLGEVTADKKHVDHGVAPAEGIELATIMDLMEA